MAKSRYTYDQFRKSAQDSGLWGQFSQADLSMAQQNPDFGMSILKTKQDYQNATTDEARAAAHRQADALRSSWGGYTGGGNGGSFVLDPMSPRDFEYEAAPTYVSRYDDTIQDLIAGLLDRPDFSYDPATDPLYQNYRKQYTREGQRATAGRPGRDGRGIRRNPLLLCQRRRQPGVQLLRGPVDRQDSRPLPTGLQPVSERLQHGFEQPGGCPGGGTE